MSRRLGDRLQFVGPEVAAEAQPTGWLRDTEPAAAGVGEREIMNQTGHRSAAMVRRYIRDGSLFRGNAAAALGL